jgi:hypothetical protein
LGVALQATFLFLFLLVFLIKDKVNCIDAFGYLYFLFFKKRGSRFGEAQS